MWHYFAPLVTLVPLLSSLLFQAASWDDLTSGGGSLFFFSTSSGGVVPTVFSISTSSLQVASPVLIGFGLAILAIVAVVLSPAVFNVLPNSGSSFFGGSGGFFRDRNAQRFDKVAEALQKLDTKIFEDRETLMALSVSELKQRAPKDDLQPSGRATRTLRGVMEKSELVDLILGKDGDTSNQMCAICFGDYENGDIQRVMACGHKFHLECVDQWILKSAADSKNPPCCPTCRHPLKIK